jgi:hypothetical protein
VLPEDMIALAEPNVSGKCVCMVFVLCTFRTVHTTGHSHSASAQRTFNSGSTCAARAHRPHVRVAGRGRANGARV